MKRKWKGFMALFLVLTLCLGVCNTEKLSAEASDNLIVNGSFDDAGQLEVWNGGGHQGDAMITAEVSETPIGEDGIMTYGKITGRSSNYQCFAQDVTDRIEKNQAYTYSFYIMLDAEGYPRAFIDFGAYRLEFEQADLKGDSLEAKVIFRKTPEEA